MSEGQRPGTGSTSRLGGIALVGLLVLSLVAGIYVYRARTPNLALEVTQFERKFDGEATIEFFVRFDEPDATVEIVGRNQVLVKTLASSIALEKEERLTCLWDGFDDEGEKAEPGRYRLRVTLPGRDREMVFPRRLDIEPKQRPDESYSFTFGDACEPSVAA